MTTTTESSSGLLIAGQRKVLQLIYWNDPRETAIVFGIGLFWFLLIGWWKHSSITVLSFACLFHLLARFCYRNAKRVLGEMNMIPPSAAVPAAPVSFPTEDECLQHLTAITGASNSALQAAYTLAVTDCSPLVLKCMAGLFATTLASKFFGTTGLFFLAFVLTFTWPALYAKKRREIDALVLLATAKASEGGRQVIELARKQSSKLPSIPKASDLARDKSTNIKPKSL
jgi:hypothetical protein